MEMCCRYGYYTLPWKVLDKYINHWQLSNGKAKINPNRKWCFDTYAWKQRSCMSNTLFMWPLGNAILRTMIAEKLLFRLFFVNTCQSNVTMFLFKLNLLINWFGFKSNLSRGFSLTGPTSTKTFFHIHIWRQGPGPKLLGFTGNNVWVWGLNVWGPNMWGHCVYLRKHGEGTSCCLHHLWIPVISAEQHAVLHLVVLALASSNLRRDWRKNVYSYLA